MERSIFDLLADDDDVTGSLTYRVVNEHECVIDLDLNATRQAMDKIHANHLKSLKRGRVLVLVVDLSR